ncbi:MAG: nucleotidyl transferase AbiEii/AbiGii toxin family protein [bacterium]|nr:nucleotidyl transferase AbiEii/AbiGii toxin family protein [bacterium]
MLRKAGSLMENHLQNLLLSLSRAGVRFVVCGGVAAVLHGVERLTVDLDVSVEMSGENLERFLSVLAKLGLEPRVPVPAEALLDPEKIDWMVQEKNALVFTFIDPENLYRQLDVFLAPGFAYEILIKNADRISIDGQEISVLSIPELLAMKRRVDPPRDKDLLDIRALEDLL